MSRAVYLLRAVALVALVTAAAYGGGWLAEVWL